MEIKISLDSKIGKLVQKLASPLTSEEMRNLSSEALNLDFDDMDAGVLKADVLSVQW